MNEETKKVFFSRPMVSFRSPRKISSYLDRTKIYLLDRVAGLTNVVRKDVKYVLMSLKQIHLLAMLLARIQNKSETQL